MSSSFSPSAATDDAAPPCCISHHFSLLAARNPDLTAVIHAPPPAPTAAAGDDRFTYSHLSSAVASLTRRLRRLIPPASPNPCVVGVHIPPSFHYIAAVLSILRSGSAFLPLDPSWPPERLQSIAADCNAAIVVRCRGTEEGVVDWGGVGVETVYADDAGESGGEEEEGETVWPCEKAREFCYVMYTSGSTGKPKGVCGTEKVISCLVNGHVLVLNSRGVVVWKAATGGPIFAGACLSSALPSQVLICSRNGSLYSFDLEDGALLWEYQTGDPITASACVDEHSCFISECSLPCDRLACICTSSGSVHVLRIRSSTKDEFAHACMPKSSMVQKVATVDLPGDIFSSPVMINGRIFVGCRDNYVHCIQLVTRSG